MSNAAVSLAETAKTNSLDVVKVRKDFPALHQQVHGKPLVYLDNAATTQKPRAVIDAITHYYCNDNANVHRGVHALSERATAAYEGTRDIIARFFGVPDNRCVVFTRGTTESINLVAEGYVRPMLKPGDEIITTQMEHHSNIVPWQILAEKTGAVLQVAPIQEDGSLDLDATLALIGEKTRFVAAAYISNALGTVNPVREIIRAAHDAGARVLLDGAQAAPHKAVNIVELDCDFFAFSGHKVYGPTGIGGLIGKMDALEEMQPYQSGGDMIRRVSFSGTEYNDIPYRFEAGTPNIADTIALGAALEYVESLDIACIAAHEDALLRHATRLVSGIPGLRIVGSARQKAAVLSFVFDGIHAHDVGTILDTEGIAVRAGHHCSMPVMERFGLPATARASLALYNTLEEMEALAGALEKVRDIFGA
ncbi:MAG: SufS family cysteine desulfurase [Gammaproteobacteria bacterium]|nr:SufS family cysteine desulfurase [Gammaproteobacteria bacterium]